MRLSDKLGDPDDWDMFSVYELCTWKDVKLSICPMCSSVVKDASKHKLHHLQEERNGQADKSVPVPAFLPALGPTVSKTR